MSCFDISAQQVLERNKCKALHMFLKDNGLEPSEPIQPHRLIQAYRLFSQQTGQLLPIMSKLSSIAPECSGLSPTVFGVDFPNGEDLRITRCTNYMPVLMHSHEHFELQICVKGSCDLYFGSHCRHLKSGDVVFVPPYTEHSSIVCDDESIVYYILMRYPSGWAFPSIFKTKNILSAFLGQNFRPDSETSYMIFHSRDFLASGGILERLLNEYNSPSSFRNELGVLLIQQMLLILLRDYSAEAAVCTLANLQTAPSVRILSYIQENANTVTLSELSTRFSYTTRHISRLIKQATGMNFSEYVNMIRMEMAAEMVLNYDMPTSQIAETCGWISYSHFYRAFRSCFGMTPKQYKARHGQVNLNRGT